MHGMPGGKLQAFSGAAGVDIKGAAQVTTEIAPSFVRAANGTGTPELPVVGTSFRSATGSILLRFTAGSAVYPSPSFPFARPLSITSLRKHHGWKYKCGVVLLPAGDECAWERSYGDHEQLAARRALTRGGCAGRRGQGSWPAASLRYGIRDAAPSATT